MTMSELGIINVAMVYCQDCENPETCTGTHTPQQTVWSTQELDSLTNYEGTYAQLQKVFCDRHPEKSIETYCFDCNIVLCILCINTENHNAHKQTELGEVAEEFRSQMTDEVVKMETGLENCRQLLEKLTKDNDAFMEQISQTEQDICGKAEQLKRMIDSHKTQLLEELREMKQERMNEVARIAGELERHSQLLEKLKIYADEAKNQGAACDIARAAGSLHERAEELLKFDVIERSLDDLGHVDVTFTSSNLVTDNAKKTVGEIVSLKNIRDVTPSKPTLMHATQQGNKVGAVTSLGDHIFVTRLNLKKVEVYRSDTLTLQRRLLVPGLGSRSFGLAACLGNQCLYVSDFFYNSVHRVQLSPGNRAVTKWTVGSHPAGLSINGAQNLIVACCWENTLQEFTTHGALVREVRLQSDVESPWHALQLSGGQFVVSHYNPDQNVSIVGFGGQMILRYTQLEGPGVGEMNKPRSLAVDRNGCILVADYYNNRILALNPSLTSAQVLPLTVGEELRGPRALFLDKEHDRLYVGEDGGCRVLAFDGVRLTTEDLPSDVERSRAGLREIVTHVAQVWSRTTIETRL